MIHVPAPTGAIAFAAALLAGAAARADGMAFKGFRPLEQGEQRAAIVHKDGVEKMAIAINIDLDENDEAVWIFPVPGTPEKVKIDVLDTFPRFSGRDPRENAASIAYALGVILRVTQLYPVCLELLAMPNLIEARKGSAVYDATEKWGVRAESMTAGSLDDLAAYLRERKRDIPTQHLRTFAPYLDDRHVLVVAWIASRAALEKEFPEYKERARYGDRGRERWPTLFVEFPAERPFYPMRPTSAYGEKTIKVDLHVQGYVAPETPRGVPHTAEYRRGHFYGPKPPLPTRFTEGLPAEPIPVTHLRYSTAARDFFDDLSFAPTTPPGLPFAELVERAASGPLPQVVALALAAVAAISYLAAGIAGLAVLGRWRGCARLGLCNVVTLLGVAVAARRAMPDAAPRFVRVFSLTVVSLSLLVQVVLAAPLDAAGADLFSASAWIFVFVAPATALLAARYRGAVARGKKEAAAVTLGRTGRLVARVLLLGGPVLALAGFRSRDYEWLVLLGFGTTIVAITALALCPPAAESKLPDAPATPKEGGPP